MCNGVAELMLISVMKIVIRKVMCDTHILRERERERERVSE